MMGEKEVKEIARMCLFEKYPPTNQNILRRAMESTDDRLFRDAIKIWLNQLEGDWSPKDFDRYGELLELWEERYGKKQKGV